ncbi:MAG TPA: hypothetical protein VEG38_20240 [Acidimicrobiia bacterium]|nr:hypothetical protein [Acidimicrobiia bacterium]
MKNGAGGRYLVAVDRLRPTAVDLDEADAAIRQRWFVWTAAGLAVAPVVWTDQNDATGRASRVERSEVQAPGSLALHVARPTAHVDVVLHRSGSAEVAVLRPEADAVVRTEVQLGSVEAFGELLDRVVELITWSGVPKERGPHRPQRAGQWVVGYDGDRYPTGA